MTRQIERILIANRGEIARRVIRACDQMGIVSIAVFTEADKDMPFIREAKTAVCLGADTQAYLDMDAILKAAKATNADAIHPGYGFLSERADFATAVEKAGIVFIGPTAHTIECMGSKIGAKKLLAGKAPLVPGLTSGTVEEWVIAAEKMGYPVLIKASAGGGGRGMRVARNADELKEAMKTAEGEALRAFGEGSVMLEKYVEEVKHIEVQIFGDAYGNVIHLLERECSLQRRHQKVIEEAPSPFVTPELRKKICASAVEIAKMLNYRGAGTVEYIVDPKTSDFYFLEVNTRLQVEHPVTELVTNLDLVALQILVAMGVKMHDALGQVRLDPTKPALTTSPVSPIGYATEVRVYAEDFNLMPTVGTVKLWESRQVAKNIAFHNAVESGSEISVHYDNMISKVVGWDAFSREACIRKTARALKDTTCFGLTNNKLFLLSILQHEEYVEGLKICTKWIADNHNLLKSIAFGMLSKDLVFESAVAGCIWGAMQGGKPHLRHLPGGWSNTRNRTETKLMKVLKNTHGILPGGLGEADDFGDVPMMVKHQKDRRGIFTFTCGEKKVAGIELLSIEPLPLYTVLRVKFGDRIKTFLVQGDASKSINEKEMFVCEVETGVEVAFVKVPMLLYPSGDNTEIATTRPCSQTNYTFTANQTEEDPATANLPGKKVACPIMAKVFKILKSTGDTVTAGETVLILESMKMETKVTTPFSGKLTLKVKPEELTRTGKTLFTVEE
eukprot:TRINITY_DN31171_c0_g1_i1.p1 TRINITY_DN31171_c0_g1~~TRINITY_DN31171_c0_g1_i1.p1  ORF type:complete len:731 (+),score=238.30 TRINITY_DN31171_c0_g1_i1:47-2239(+)